MASTFESKEYRKILGSIEGVRKELGDGALELAFPQIVVIGDQSSGKSSLLTEVSGVAFPSNSGITTKCPIVVYTTHRQDKEVAEFSVEKDGEAVMCTKEELPAKILELQEIALGGSKVTKKAITIRGQGKDFEDLVLVDLPGIISNGDGKDAVVQLIERYIEPEQSLVLVVTEAKQDDETQQALELAKRFDPSATRTIRVLTKFDVFDSEKAKTRAVSLVSSGEGELSPHAIVCRPGGETFSTAAEYEKLAGLDLPSERAGVSSLRQRLPELLCRLVKTNLPDLKNQVHDELQKNKRNLERVGREAPNDTEILTRIQEELGAALPEFEIQLSRLLKGFQESVHGSESMLTPELVDQTYEHNVFKCPFFQGETAFYKILRQVNLQWRDHLNVLHRDVSSAVEKLFDIDGIDYVRSRLKVDLKSNWVDTQRKFLARFETLAVGELAKEQDFKTMNHYLTSKYAEKLVLPDEVIDDITESITIDTVSTKVNYRGGDRQMQSIETIRQNISELMRAAVEKNIDTFKREKIEEQHKRRVLAAVKANWSVAHKNLIDSIMSAVHRLVICEIKGWVKKTIVQDEGIRRFAGEDPKIAKCRIEYRKCIETMGRCLKILQGC